MEDIGPVHTTVEDGVAVLAMDYPPVNAFHPDRAWSGVAWHATECLLVRITPATHAPGMALQCSMGCSSRWSEARRTLPSRPS